MTFAQNMIAMTPEQVRQAVLLRLRDGTGIFAPTSREEPVWAMLQSAFRHWRGDTSKTKAVDEALNDLLPAAFEQRQWRRAQDTCEFAVALVTGSPPWVPPSVEHWPLQQWLQAPTTSHGKVGAAITAMWLFLALSKAPPTQWVRDKFKAACTPKNAQGLEERRWFEACWKACLHVQGGQAADGAWRLPLFQALAFARRCEVLERERLLRGLIAHAWLATESAHRGALNDAIVKAARDFEDPDFSELVLRIAQQEFGDAYRATVLPVTGAAQGAKRRAWLRAPVSAIDQDKPEYAHRRSELCPA